MSGRAGVFLDRDGTIIEDAGYLADPADVRLLPGSADAIARLNRAGLPVIVVTNQSGIARGLLDENQYQATATRLDSLLGSARAAIDAHYHCPHHPDITGACECRKPGTLLYRQAIGRFGLDPRASWWIGDRLRDVEAAVALGGRGVLVRTGEGMSEARRAGADRFAGAADLAEAVELVLRAADER